MAGLLETLGPFLGISGDLNDHPAPQSRARGSRIDPARGRAFMRQYFALKGLPASTSWGQQDAVAAMDDLFGAWLQN